MKKSNWREEFNAPSAVKKIINEFVDPATAAIGTSAIVKTGGALTATGAATGTSLLPWAAGAGALGLTAAATRKKKKKGCDDDCKNDKGHIPSNFKTITSKNPQ
tara:strand:- start:523 stop:834 length:312 start_codon:yes stop_codon:yes gene_type:complete